MGWESCPVWASVNFPMINTVQLTSEQILQYPMTNTQKLENKIRNYHVVNFVHFIQKCRIRDDENTLEMQLKGVIKRPKSKGGTMK